MDFSVGRRCQRFTATTRSCVLANVSESVLRFLDSLHLGLLQRIQIEAAWIRLANYSSSRTASRSEHFAARPQNCSGKSSDWCHKRDGLARTGRSCCIAIGFQSTRFGGLGAPRRRTPGRSLGLSEEIFPLLGDWCAHCHSGRQSGVERRDSSSTRLISFGSLRLSDPPSSLEKLLSRSCIDI